MRCKIIILIAVFSGLILAFAFGQEQEQEAVQPAGPLLRTDLLNFDRPPLKKSLRNIFIPFHGGGPGISGGLKGEQERGPGGLGAPAGEEGLSAEQSAMASISSLPRIDLRYIGYVGNEEKLVGLIFREGEAIAVKQEDILPDGVRIIRVSKEEVEVELPGGENIKFSLEGEEK